MAAEVTRYEVGYHTDGRIELLLRVPETVWAHLVNVLFQHATQGDGHGHDCEYCRELGLALRTKATGERRLPQLLVSMAAAHMPGT